MKSPVGRLIYKTVERFAPLSKKPQGVYMLFAFPNMAGKAFGAEVPSFRKPYLVREYAVTSERDKARALAEMGAQFATLTSLDND